MKDFTIVDGPQWTIHPVYCDNIVVKNVTIDSKGTNTDGLNPDSCNHVLIEGCSFNTGDDCIAINSGMNEDGLRVNRPCTDIEIRDCVMIGGHGIDSLEINLLKNLLTDAKNNDNILLAL